jgi:ribosomal protein L37AE/L43A
MKILKAILNEDGCFVQCPKCGWKGEIFSEDGKWTCPSCKEEYLLKMVIPWVDDEKF